MGELKIAGLLCNDVPGVDVESDKGLCFGCFGVSEVANQEKIGFGVEILDPQPHPLRDY